MPNIFKPAGNSKYVLYYTVGKGKRRKKTLETDKVVSERIARDFLNRVALRREGLFDASGRSVPRS